MKGTARQRAAKTKEGTKRKEGKEEVSFDDENEFSARRENENEEGERTFVRTVEKRANRPSAIALPRRSPYKIGSSNSRRTNNRIPHPNQHLALCHLPHERLPVEFPQVGDSLDGRCWSVRVSAVDPASDEGC